VPKTQIDHQEIVKNYLAELHIRDGVNEAIISNLQSSLYPRVLQGYRKDKRDLKTMDKIFSTRRSIQKSKRVFSAK
jgi:predicted transcriptional regulator